MSHRIKSCNILRIKPLNSSQPSLPLTYSFSDSVGSILHACSYLTSEWSGPGCLVLVNCTTFKKLTIKTGASSFVKKSQRFLN